MEILDARWTAGSLHGSKFGSDATRTTVVCRLPRARPVRATQRAAVSGTCFLPALPTHHMLITCVLSIEQACMMGTGIGSSKQMGHFCTLQT